MEQTTRRYSKSMSSSVGAGMKSLIGGSGRRFFVLEHKITSKYYRAGEEQKIIVDQVEIGRDPSCAVRLVGQQPDDPMFRIVSRRHAAIQKEGDNWVLIHLSQVNSTFLNGQKFSHVGQKWYLQSGDEIRIAENGPKLCFKIPPGDSSLVKSLGLTARMSLFRQQALRPYKTAIASLACILILASCVGAKMLHDQTTKIDEADRKIDEAGGEINRLNVTLDAQKDYFERGLDSLRAKNIRDSIASAEDAIRYRREIDEARARADSAMAIALRRGGGRSNSGISALIEEQQILKDVYFLRTQKIVLVHNGTEAIIKRSFSSDENYGWSGTGFLLDDGTFVTARHCIEGWWYPNALNDSLPSVDAGIRAASYQQCHIKGYYEAVSSMSGNRFLFTSDDFVVDRDLDEKVQVGTDEEGKPLYWNFTFPFNEHSDPKMYATDWAYTKKTNGRKGQLVADVSLSRSMLPMQDLVVIGFPMGLGIQDGGSDTIEPISASLKTSRRGLAANGCLMHSRGTDHGNSGGPIFAIKDGRLVVVAIVSRGDPRTEEYNWAVPICNIYNR